MKNSMEIKIKNDLHAVPEVAGASPEVKPKQIALKLNILSPFTLALRQILVLFVIAGFNIFQEQPQSEGWGLQY